MVIEDIDEWFEKNKTNEIIEEKKFTPNQNEFPNVFIDDEEENYIDEEGEEEEE